MILARSFDAEWFNTLINDPDIRPFVGGDIGEPVDITAAVEAGRNVFWRGEHGGFVMSWCAPGVYEVHTLIRADGRGEWALSAAKEVLARMASEFGAEKVWTRVEPKHRHTRLFTRAAGMTEAGRDLFDIGAGPVEYLIYEWRA